MRQPTLSSGCACSTLYSFSTETQCAGNIMELHLIIFHPKEGYDKDKAKERHKGKK
jgi:hypothetical protein